MAPALILFDVDGTLVDTAGAGRRAMERACARVFGLDGVELGSAGVPFAGRTDPVILEEVTRALGIEPERYRTSRADLERRFLEELRSELARPEPQRRVLPGVLPLLDDLATRDELWLGLLTGNIEAGARLKLDVFDLNRFFPSGGFSSDDPDRRRIARIARAKLEAHSGKRFPPDRVTVVGDTHHDVDCARANGFRSVAVNSGWVERRSLEQARPDHLLEDLSDLERTLAALSLA